MGVPQDTVCVLLQSLLTHEVALLDGRAIGGGIVAQSKFLQLIVKPEFIVIAIPMGVMS